MKREYITPEAEIEEFVLSSKALITTSGFEEGEGENVEW